MLTRMSEEDWDVVLMVFRAVLPRRGDKGRDDCRGGTATKPSIDRGALADV